MPQQWFVRQGDDEIGPFSSKTLKQLAASGRLTADDLVRRADRPGWKQARTIRGLFAANPSDSWVTSESRTEREAGSSVSQPPPIPVDADSASPSPPLIGTTWVIFVSLLFCFPVGLYFIWTQPEWTPLRKWSWTGAYFGVLLFGVLLGDDPPRQEESTASSPLEDSSSSQVEETDQIYRVRRGFFQNDLIVELHPVVARELELSDFSWDRWRLDFKVYWKGSTGGRTPNPWHYSAYDSEETKLDGSVILLPGTVSLGDTFKTHIVLQREAAEEVARIVIHP